MRPQILRDHEVQPPARPGTGLWDGRVMRRVSVVGNSGSGKSTLAKALAARLAVTHTPGHDHGTFPDVYDGNIP
jgi:predicted NACHT family NTPase